MEILFCWNRGETGELWGNWMIFDFIFGNNR